LPPACKRFLLHLGVPLPSRFRSAPPTTCVLMICLSRRRNIAGGVAHVCRVASQTVVSSSLQLSCDICVFVLTDFAVCVEMFTELNLLTT
jgi:hypothetical protein